MTGAPRPPRLAEWLLERVVPAALAEPFLGDLAERFERDARERGPGAARRRYWREALRPPLRAPSVHPTPSPVRESAMRTLFGDLRHAVRIHARRPAFLAVAAVTLALGIGATTAIFSVVSPILFRPLPYPHAERVLVVGDREPGNPVSNTGWATFADIARETRSFAAIAAYRDWDATVIGRGDPERLPAQRVSASYFSVLGLHPALGRDFRPEEDVVNGPREVILSDALWRTRFGADSAIVGHAVTLNSLPYVVAGVMPPFENATAPTAKLWAPLQYDLSLPYACRTCRHLRALGRLREGVTQARAEQELEALSRRLVAEYPQAYSMVGIGVIPLRDRVTSGVRPALLALLGAVTLVLLIACANVTNLLLARGTLRRSEFAVRAALGASRGRLVRQLLTESLLLAAFGGALGIALAEVGVRALVALGASHIPRLADVHVDAGLLVVAIVVTSLVGVLFGLVPAMHASRVDLHEGIKLGSRRTVGGGQATRGALVVGEVAVALVLLVGAGLLLRSVGRLLAVPAGFTADGLLTMQLQASGPRYQDDTATRRFFDEALARVRAVPGVDAAALTSQLPLSGDFDKYGIHDERHPRANPELDPAAFRYGVSPRYLETMGIALRRGRSIGQADDEHAPLVVLVSEGFARRAWPGEEAVGRRISMGGSDGPWRTIVGVVADVRQQSLAAEDVDAVYVPEAQWQFADAAMSLVVRARGDPAALAPAIRRAVWSVDRDQPIARVATMTSLLADSAAERRFALRLFELFAAVALVLAAAGIYGVLTGSVTERLREIGVRAALGASRRELLAMVLRRGAALTLGGIAIGSVAAALCTRAIGGMLFGISPIDPATYVAVAATLLVVALLACLAPAWRAAAVDPVETLRAE